MALVAALLAVAGLTAPGAGSASTTATPLPNPTWSSSGTRNVAFYYRGNLPLETATPEQLTAAVGHPAIVVGSRSDDEPAATRAIRSIDALPYRYFQLYWVPGDRDYEGIDLRAHPDWAFCATGDTPAPGRTQDGVDWTFVDLNERAVHDAVLARLDAIQKAGWAGIMLDRGQAATQNAADASGRSIWASRSSCTGDPVKAGATFSDAYVSITSMAQSLGLQVLFNNGGSPFGPPVAMRPDPRDADCRTQRWKACARVDDVWPRSNLVLNELADSLRDHSWRKTFLANRASERTGPHAHRTVALVTTNSVGGDAGQTRPNIYYVWARTKLFDLPVAVNTGDAPCPTAGAGCNHYDTYPELVDLRYGRPLASGPVSSACTKGSTVACVWRRHYTSGLDVVNVSPARRTLRDVPLGVSGCRYVYDQLTRRPVASGRCVSRLTLTLGAWSGHPLRYSRKPW